MILGYNIYQPWLGEEDRRENKIIGWKINYFSWLKDFYEKKGRKRRERRGTNPLKPVIFFFSKSSRIGEKVIEVK